MKTLFLVGAATLALTSGALAADPGYPAQTSHALTGDLGLYGGLYSLKNDDPSYNDNSDFLFGGLGRANLWLSPNVSAQFDVGGESLNDSTFGYSYTVFDVAGHLSYRGGPGHLVGVFTSFGQNSNVYVNTATIGLEGQAYLGPFLLYAQGGYTTTIGNNYNNTGNYDQNAWYIHGEARYFVNPNLMLAANVGIGRGEEVQEPATHDLIRWGADLEWKHDSAPFGAFVSYQGGYADETTDPGEQFTVHTVMAGFKLYFGNETLKAQSDSGATLKDFNPHTGVNHVRFFDWN